MKFSYILKSLFFSNSLYKKLPVYIFLMKKNKAKSRLIRKTLQRNCFIYQNVTIGSKINSSNMPSIKQNCEIFTGAMIFGDIIGENSVICTNAVVNVSVPANSIVVGYNKIISKSSSKQNN